MHSDGNRERPGNVRFFEGERWFFSQQHKFVELGSDTWFVVVAETFWKGGTCF